MAAPLLPSERLAVRDKQSRLAVVSPFTGARCSFIHIKIKPGARGRLYTGYSRKPGGHPALPPGRAKG